VDVTGVTVPDRTPWEAWRALPRAVRKEVHRLVKAGHGHPDPAVARTALAWGRSVRRAAGWLLVAAVGCFLAGLAVNANLHTGSRGRDIVVTLAVLALGATGQVFFLQLTLRGVRAEHANLRALLQGDPSRHDVGTSQSVTIHRGRRFRSCEFAAVLMGAAFIASVLFVRDPELGGPDAFDFVCFAIVVALFAVVFVRVYPGGRTPLIVLSPDGLHLPHRRVTVPWSAFTWADLELRGLASRDPALVWTLTTEAVYDRVRRRGVWAKERWRMRDSRTIVIPVSWMVENPEVALAASWRFAEAAR
jgi:hypothetical protein